MVSASGRASYSDLAGTIREIGGRLKVVLVVAGVSEP
jgi:hypothetical protein